MNFIDLPFNVLRCLGIFSLDTSKKWISSVFNIYRVIILTLLTLVIILMTAQLFLVPDLTILARTIDMWTMLLSGLYKWCFMIMFNGEFARLKTSLIQIQSQGSIAYGKSADQQTNTYLKPLKQVTIWYLISGIIVAICIILNPLVTYPKGDRSTFEYFNDPKTYPLSCWKPFLVDETWMFLVIYFCHSIALTVIILIYLGIDSYMFTAIYAAGGQFELLNRTINNIDSCISVEASNNTIQSLCYNGKQQTKCYSVLKECAKHHILILNYIKKLQKLFSTLIIVDYLHGITSVTFALFQLTISVDIVETLMVVSFIVVSFGHQFLNNFFGEFIIQKQLSVRQNLYNIPWWRMANKNLHQILSIMLCRTLKPNVITGFYMYKLCFNSFISFSKALYTYYMVLRSINGQAPIS